MLSDTTIRNAKPGEKPRKLLDEKGLFLLLNQNGSRWWRFRYRISGKEKLLSFRVYPEVTLKEAREKRDEARKMLRDGIVHPRRRRPGRIAHRGQTPSRRSPGNGSRSFLRRGFLLTERGSSGDWSGTFFLGSASARSTRSRLRNFWRFFGGSNRGGRSRRRTGPPRTAARSSGMPSPPGGRKEILRRIFAGRSLRPKLSITLLSRIPRRSAFSFGPSTDTRGASSSGRPSGWRLLSFFVPESSVASNGRRSTLRRRRSTFPARR